MGLATRVNGTAPPEVPLADIELGTWDFWALEDDLRDGAFTTLRREAAGRGPAARGADLVLAGARAGRFPERRRALGTDRTRRCVLRQPPPRDLQLQPQHHHQRPDAGGIRVLRLDDRARRPAASAAAIDRQQGLHPEGGSPHRGVGARASPPAGRVDDRGSSRRPGRRSQRACRAAAVAGHLRHDGHPRAGPSADIPLDQRHPRLRRSRSDQRIR